MTDNNPTRPVHADELKPGNIFIMANGDGDRVRIKATSVTVEKVTVLVTYYPYEGPDDMERPHLSAMFDRHDVFQVED